MEIRDTYMLASITDFIITLQSTTFTVTLHSRESFAFMCTK